MQASRRLECVSNIVSSSNQAHLVEEAGLKVARLGRSGGHRRRILPGCEGQAADIGGQAADAAEQQCSTGLQRA